MEFFIVRWKLHLIQNIKIFLQHWKKIASSSGEINGLHLGAKESD